MSLACLICWCHVISQLHIVFIQHTAAMPPQTYSHQAPTNPSGLNWQQQLQQANAAPPHLHGGFSSIHSSYPPSGSLYGTSQQAPPSQRQGSHLGGSVQGGAYLGGSLQGGTLHADSLQGGSMGSMSSPSVAAAAAATDSWSWLDAFEQKQQFERASGWLLTSISFLQPVLPSCLLSLA